MDSADGVRIHYVAPGEGSPLLMLHGFAGSSTDWHRFGYVDGLQSENQLILMDERGHGRSNRPLDAKAYAIPNRISDVLHILDHLNLDKVDILGYSMGGELAWGMAEQASDRVRSLIVGGMPPRLGPPEIFEELIGNLEQGLDFAAGMWGLKGSTMHRFMENSADALIASIQAIRDWQGYAGSLSALDIPCLLYTGETDLFARQGMSDAARTIPNCRLEILSGLDHGQAYSRGDLVVPLIRQFLAAQNQI